MHILLTDVLVCPRCGPSFGLILLADRIEERRVLAGRLGCANCREQYPIRAGAADLRTTGGPAASAGASGDAPAGATEDTVPSTVPSTEATRLAALLGVSQGPAYVLLAGAAAGYATEISALLDDVEVIALSPRGSGEHDADMMGVSQVAAGAIPIATGKMTGVAVTGPATEALLEESARAVRPTGRLLVDPAPADAEERLRAMGLRTIAREGAVLLAVRG